MYSSTELVKPVDHEPTPMVLIQTAMENGLEPEKLEKLLDLQERWEANEQRKAEQAAKVAYNRSMAECQAEIEPVKAMLKNEQTRSLYADIEAIDSKIRPVYTAHGFSISSGTTKSETPEHVYVYVDVLHKDGHRERYGDDFPLDDKGIKGTVNKTPIHSHASTTTYARRYLICGVFNIAISRSDNDGNGSTKPISEGQIAALQKLLDRIHPDDDALGSMLQWAQVEKIEELPSHMFLQAKQALEIKVAKYEGNEQ